MENTPGAQRAPGVFSIPICYTHSIMSERSGAVVSSGVAI